MDGTSASASRTPMDELIATVAHLRGPNGCPWDAEQTHESLVRYLLEESYELVDAIEDGGRDELLEELGDVLYQVILHSDLAETTPGEEFTVQDVAAALNAKLIGRHPHVFGDGERTAETADDVVAFWDELKAEEKPHRTSVLDGVPMGMPSLLLADKIMGKAEKFELFEGEEFEPLEIEDEEELGAMLLLTVRSARLAGLDAERALRTALRVLQGDIEEAETAEEAAAAETTATS